MQTDKKDEDSIYCVQPGRDKIKTELPNRMQMGNMKGKNHFQNVECGFENDRVSVPGALLEQTSKTAESDEDNEICIEIERGVAVVTGKQLADGTESSCTGESAGVEIESSAEDIATRCSPQEM